MQASTMWWILCALVVGAEMLTGTFYLLMMALGMLVAALAAHLGASMPVQISLAALVSSGAAAAWHVARLRRNPPQSHDPQRNATRNRLDIGGIVTVQSVEADGTATVQYRGAPWSAVADGAHTPLAAGRWSVADIRNNQLVLQPLSS